jgi:hypothetical protein
MVRFLIFFLFAMVTPAAAEFAVYTPAAAESYFANLKVVCTRYDDVAKHLSEKYSEAVVARAPTNMGTTMETWAASDGKTWTVLLRQTDGTACTLSSGDGYKMVPGKGT